MRFLLSAALFAALASQVSAQTSTATAVIKNGMGPVAFLRFSPDGQELARICQFGPVALFSTNSYNKLRTFSIGMRMVAYSSDGTRIATAEGTDGARVWDAALPGKRLPSSPAVGVEEVYLLDTPLQVLQAPSRDAMVRVFWTEFSPDGSRLITTHANGHVKVFNTSSWAVEDDLMLTESEVRAAALSPDGKTLVIGDVGGLLHVWSVEQKVEIKRTSTPGAILAIAFAADGRTFVTVHRGPSLSVVLIWDTTSKVPDERSGFISATFSKDGTILALGGSHIELIDPTSRKQLRIIELPEMTLREANQQFENQPGADVRIPVSITALAFSPDGRTLAAGLRDGTVRLLKINP